MCSIKVHLANSMSIFEIKRTNTISTLKIIIKLFSHFSIENKYSKLLTDATNIETIKGTSY